MKKPKLKTDWIPKNWTFESKEVASRFDSHVREQLSWYDTLTASVVHIAAHYIPRGGVVYDIGASTGNIARALEPFILDRKVEMISIESSEEMAMRFRGPGSLLVESALEVNFKPFDFGVCMLTLMFLPVDRRRAFLADLISRLKPGGAIVVVDKVLTAGNYPAVVIRSLAMKWKLDAGATAEEIVAKQLSLGGVQRPIDERIIPAHAVEFFRFGEFAGWIIERPEYEQS